MKVPVYIMTPNVQLITTINNVPSGHIPRTQDKNFSHSHSYCLGLSQKIIL